MKINKISIYRNVPRFFRYMEIFFSYIENHFFQCNHRYFCHPIIVIIVIQSSFLLSSNHFYYCHPNIVIQSSLLLSSNHRYYCHPIIVIIVIQSSLLLSSNHCYYCHQISSGWRNQTTQMKKLWNATSSWFVRITKFTINHVAQYERVPNVAFFPIIKIYLTFPNWQICNKYMSANVTI